MGERWCLGLAVAALMAFPTGAGAQEGTMSPVVSIGSLLERGFQPVSLSSTGPSLGMWKEQELYFCSIGRPTSGPQQERLAQAMRSLNIYLNNGGEVLAEPIRFACVRTQ